LPFAKAESVQALRNQLANANAAVKPATQPTRRMGAAPADVPAYREAPPQSSFPWGTLLVVAAIVAIGAAMLRRRQRAMEASPANYSAPGAAPYGQPMYGPGYAPQQPYPPGYAPQPSMGSSIARGVGTGLAIGAGALAAQEIGRRMFEHGNANASPLSGDNGSHPTLDQIDEG